MRATLTTRIVLSLGALALFSAPVRALYEGAPAAAPAAPAARPTFVLDPGHGGDDQGAVVGRAKEKDIALAISLKVKKRLEALGETGVRLTRDDDRYIPLDRRVEDVEAWSGNVFVSLHLNKVRHKKARGITVYAFGKESFKLPKKRRHPELAMLPPPPKELARESGALATAIVRSLRAQGLKVDDPARAGFYVLKNPNVPSVLIELGYMSNPQEFARLTDARYQDRLAEALAVSLESYLSRGGFGDPAVAKSGR